MSQKDFREVAVAIIEFAEAIDEAKVGGFKLTDIATFAGPALKLPAAYEGWEDGVAYLSFSGNSARSTSGRWPCSRPSRSPSDMSTACPCSASPATPYR